jgi:hypothetical protein
MNKKCLVKSAQFWYDAATIHMSDSPTNRLEAMKQAFNHTETALAFLLEKSSDDVKATFNKINQR